MYDTVKGSDWLGDQDAIHYMAREAPKGNTRSQIFRGLWGYFAIITRKLPFIYYLLFL